MGIPFGRYELLRKIASGGMGQVLLARKGSEGFEKLVVIKRILPHLVEDEEFFTMFLDEARITMRLDHPNIARINEFGSEGGVHFIEMEYIAGEDIRRVDRVARASGGALPLGIVLKVIADAAAGLDFAHKAKDQKGQPLNLVHRDVSPQNVLVGFDGSVKLIDFGVAKAAGRSQHTATGILKGKFPYMSPEQADGLDLDARSDVFALGIVLWELLTGKRLFKGDNDLATQRLVRACQVAAPSTLEPSVPAELDAVVLKALARKPADRYPDARGLQLALEDFALANAIPHSATVLAAFMQKLYAARIARDADPKSLEEDSGLTDLDAGGLSRNTGAATVASGQRTRATGSVPAPQQTIAVAPPTRGGNKGLWVAMGLVALLVLGVAAVVLLKGNTSTTTTPPVTAQPAVDVPKTPTLLELTFTSEPAGADLELGGSPRGQTPLSLKVELDKLPLLLRLSRDGYEPAQATITADSGPTVALTLKKKSRPSGGPKTPDIKTTR